MGGPSGPMLFARIATP
ncbi:DUF6053 domain-containing protein [Lysobacter enzymogenes]